MRRVDEAMRVVLSDAISKDLQDPRVGFVTVTGVKTSPDLRQARVYVSVLGDEDERLASLAALQAAHGYLQGRIAHALRLKHTPTLTFGYDESIDRGMRITELLDVALPPEPAPPHDQPPPPDGAPPLDGSSVSEDHT